MKDKPVKPLVKRTRSVAKAGLIKKRDRKVFNFLSNPTFHKIEYGGALDFNKDGILERYVVTPGKRTQVMLDPDYEALYHTHPFKDNSPPSVDDIETLMNSKAQKVEVIFKDGSVFVIIKTKTALSRMPKDKQERKRLLEFAVDARSEKRTVERLRNLGFTVLYFKKSDAPLKIPLKIVEPEDYQ